MNDHSNTSNLESAGLTTQRRRRAVEVCTEIAAPAERIWEVLSDINGWSRWNPLYATASGVLRVGELIDLSVVLPGMKPQKIRARVQESRAPERVRYQAASLGGLVTANRYVEIVGGVSGPCMVLNGEIMGGLLGPLVGSVIAGNVREGLRSMNEALKALAEVAAPSGR